uniref:Nucleosome assembly protein 1 like 1 n=1 Tax=Pavo cristatus TaxID=9049 RepID=A0A8C9FHY4_PAVCR
MTQGQHSKCKHLNTYCTIWAANSRISCACTTSVLVEMDMFICMLISDFDLQITNVVSLQFFLKSFTLEFHFEPNDYFTNEVLTKTYRMRSEPDDSDPFSFDGPEIMGCTGCQIDWKKGKNVTLKTIKKKQKHKGRGTVRTVTKTVSNDSFFNFFSPPEVPESGDLDDDAEAILAADFEIGHFLRERIVPRSVLYFTGEAIEDDDDDVSNEVLQKLEFNSLKKLKLKNKLQNPKTIYR